MDSKGGNPGTRQTNLKKSFKLGVRSLLTACSKEEFCKAFSKFSPAEQERLHRLFIQVVSSLHENIEDEFESLCLETEAGTVLDTVEHLVEEQSLDPLSSEKLNLFEYKGQKKAENKEQETNIEETGKYLSETKKNEINYLMGMLEKAEEQKRLISSRLEFLKKEKQEFSGATDFVDKLRTGTLSYSTGNNP
ncbi:uncharacterized protein LOC116022677 isoform X1 [Ipomoea triloba]|uniref:uncharacterized protein LOC116022677 isoform X1 n=1 Tax=Ipomoea triloba TaxID=35885 RepID=UPI00125D5F46|nr:uncharacterized protein LOC116022677 isoform X1 [Ipomoea triloba]XP_031119351.1 uncharacterized protein LOC116022677 isoform X1 [Ipomoea triloba]XP_031119352.1 uncharacterized protein LOC116022677 isoform X1 [Ipomoea triloba]XP_031119353.1 uncharacterized protein LOC116022677 isoform X1 [Ipomoea triloba]